MYCKVGSKASERHGRLVAEDEEGKSCDMTALWFCVGALISRQTLVASAIICMQYNKLHTHPTEVSKFDVVHVCASLDFCAVL